MIRKPQRMVRPAPHSAWLSRLALAYVLVLQAVLGGAALGLSAQPGFAADGAAWCTGSGSTPPGGPLRDAPHHDLSCLTCCLAGIHHPGLAGGDGPGFIAPARRAFAARFTDRMVAAPLAAQPTAFDARGPPGTA